MSAPTPSPDAMRRAADWLDQNEAEPGNGEREDCRAVSAWLVAEAEKRERAAVVRRLSRESGAKPAQVRAYLARKGITP